MESKNIKIHFAGSDGEEIFEAALKCADINYRLYSCYKYILKKKAGDDFTLPEDDIIIYQGKHYKHVIQDSGLFTLMFGAGKGNTQTKESLTEWQDKLIAFVEQNNLICDCVEIDCQKVLGVKEAWYFRERMRKKLKNRQINVFHYEDGKDGLNALIDFSNYIAISVPEIRIVKPKTYKKDIYALTRYIKSRKPDIDIHLLGCTEVSILKENTFCTSADSTSWLQGVKYGFINDGTKRDHVNKFSKELYKQREKEVHMAAQERNVVCFQTTLKYATNASLCATICKQKYTKVCGDQN